MPRKSRRLFAFPQSAPPPFCGAGGFWGADASPICNTRSDFFQGGVLFFLIALCYINKKRVAMCVSPAHSCALFFFVREIGGQGGDSRTWAASPGGRNMRAPCAGAPARGYPKPHRPFGAAAAGRLSAAEPAKPAGGRFSGRMQAKKGGTPARQSPLGEKGPACGQRGAPCCLPVAALLTKRNIMRTRYMRAIADTIRLRRHRMYLCCPAGGVRWNRRKLRWNRKQTIFLKRKILEN